MPRKSSLEVAFAEQAVAQGWQRLLPNTGESMADRIVKMSGHADDRDRVVSGAEV